MPGKLNPTHSEAVTMLTDKFIGNQKVFILEVSKMKLGEPDES